MKRKRTCDRLLLPSPASNPEAQTVDLARYGLPGVAQLGGCKVRATYSAGRGMHSHGCYQITICTHGSIAFKGDQGQSWTLLPGHILVFPPDSVHRLVVNARGNLRYWLFLKKPSRTRRLMEGMSPEESEWLLKRLGALGPHLYRIRDQEARLPERMFRTIQDPRYTAPERGFRLRALMMRLLLAIADAQPLDGGQGDVVEPIAARMANAPGKPYSMDEIVSETKLSPTTILNLFRRETGKTPHQYLMACRLRRAEELLAGTKRKVTDIALSLGFSSSQHFAACFRRETGKTPRQWRAQSRGKRA